jgi:NitT/TauT family transport system permease protein
MSSLARLLDVALVGLAILVGWQGVHWYAGEVAMTSPAETLRHVGVLLGQERFWPHLWASVHAFAYALVIAWAGGIGIGVVLGGHRLSGEVAEPILIALYSLPKVTLYPVILLVFGLGLSAKVAFGAIHGIIPVAIFAMNAVRNIRPVYLKAARSMKLAPPATALRILIPAALPEVVTGLRVGFSLTLLGVLIGEMFASQAGLGFLVINAIGRADTKSMMAVVLMLFLFAVIASSILLWIDHRLHKRA